MCRNRRFPPVERNPFVVCLGVNKLSALKVKTSSSFCLLTNPFMFPRNSLVCLETRKIHWKFQHGDIYSVEAYVIRCCHLGQNFLAVVAACDIKCNRASVTRHHYQNYHDINPFLLKKVHNLAILEGGVQ